MSSSQLVGRSGKSSARALRPSYECQPPVPTPPLIPPIPLLSPPTSFAIDAIASPAFEECGLIPELLVFAIAPRRSTKQL